MTGNKEKGPCVLITQFFYKNCYIRPRGPGNGSNAAALLFKAKNALKNKPRKGAGVCPYML